MFLNDNEIILSELFCFLFHNVTFMDQLNLAFTFIWETGSCKTGMRNSLNWNTAARPTLPPPSPAYIPGTWKGQSSGSCGADPRAWRTSPSVGNHKVDAHKWVWVLCLSQPSNSGDGCGLTPKLEAAKRSEAEMLVLVVLVVWAK